MQLKNYPLGRQHDIVVQQLKSEVLIYDLKTNRIFRLNETVALVFNECDGKKSFEEISRSVSRKLKIPVNRELVWLALEALRKNELLTNTAGLDLNFDRQSRRELIRKAGFACLTTLPLVTAVMAPKAVMAQSATCVPAGVQATASAPNTTGSGLLDCLSAASKKCCNVPPFAFQSSGPNVCDGFECTCTYDCK